MTIDPCLYCGEAIEPPSTDVDYAGPNAPACAYVDASGIATVRRQHVECAMRSVIGSVGHQRARCSCFGGTEEDPPGMSTREAARAAVAWWWDEGRGAFDEP